MTRITSNFLIHDYFLAKVIDQLRPGGIAAFITSTGTLDKSNPTVRKNLAQRAELVAAIRLPNTAFKEKAGTSVSSYILFFQKREKMLDIEPDWVHLDYTENGVAVNSYFVGHLEMMLGKMEYSGNMFGKNSKYVICVNLDEDFNLYDALSKQYKILVVRCRSLNVLQRRRIRIGMSYRRGRCARLLLYLCL